MNQRTVVLSAAVATVLASTGPASVHPHVFAEARLDVMLNGDQTVKSLRHLWRFDDLFSSTVLVEFDKNGDLKLDDAELQEVSNTVFASLAEYDYFQLVSADGKDVAMKPPAGLMANYENDQLIILFESEPKEPLKLKGKVDFGVYDPTFYTAIDFVEDENMAVQDLPASCKRAVIRPDPDEAISQNQANLTDAFFNDPSGHRSQQDFRNAPRTELRSQRIDPVNKTAVRVTFGIIAIVYVLTHFLGHAHASSLGIGTNEATVPSTGFFAGWMNWINVQQQGFYRSLTGALKGMRDDGSKLWLIVGLSFAYGIFHAAGPGHGKAVISSYMLANEVALRRGVLLSFVSAFLQALTAIVVMTLAFLVLRGTSVSMTDATWFLEVASYALITLFGAWLLWRKAGPRILGLFGAHPAYSLSAAHAHSHAHSHAAHSHSHASAHSHVSHSHAHHDHKAHDHAHHGHAAHDHAAGEVCETCGHSHAPDPKLLTGDHFSWKTAWSAVTAVGLRPCSGALIVLSFAFLNGLWAGGILSVFAMALGTAITVSLLATLAVTAKNWAVAYAGDGRAGNSVHATIEIAGAAFVLILGLLLLTASLTA